MVDYWMRLPFLLKLEISQRKEEGCDISSLESALAAVDESTPVEEMAILYDRLQALPVDADFPYEEPSDLAAILAARPKPKSLPGRILSEAELRDRIYDLWGLAGAFGGLHARQAGRRADQGADKNLPGSWRGLSSE